MRLFILLPKLINLIHMETPHIATIFYLEYLHKVDKKSKLAQSLKTSIKSLLQITSR